MNKADTKANGHKIPHLKLLVALVALVAVAAILWGISHRKPATPPSLKLVSKDGEVLFTENGAVWEFADVGTSLNFGSAIKTGDKAKAVLQTPDGGVIRMDENTELKVNSVTDSGILLTQDSGKTFNRLNNKGTGSYQINALGETLKATGGAFECSVNSIDQRINVKVFEGQTDLTLADGTAPIPLAKGREITVDSKANTPPIPADISSDYANTDWYLWNKAEDLKLGITLGLSNPNEAVATPNPGSSATTDATTLPATPKTNPIAPKAATPSSTSGTGSCKPSLSLKRGLGGMGIQLNWTTCNNDNFQFYKVVRSITNSSPAFPSTPALATSSNHFFGSYLDKNLAIGTLYYYRVCVVERLNKIGCGNVAKMAN
jgi:hypothetical protein